MPDLRKVFDLRLELTGQLVLADRVGMWSPRGLRASEQPCDCFLDVRSGLTP
jgi:hypothetical protein